jgi:predicted dehydrogenase
MKKQKINWGIIGCGRIAHKFADDLKWAKNARLTAVASRDLNKAKQFSKEFNVKTSYGSYEELATSKEIDVVYIATPHSLHYENTLLCLEHGKAVLCEKPFAINSRQSMEMIALAKQKQVFLMEAVWTKFLPHYQKTLELIQRGKLGEIKSVIANFGFQPWQDAPERLLDPALGGGSLLDIGIYNVFMALTILGKPDEIQAKMVPGKLGIDEQCAIQFMYQNGAMAQLFSSLSTNLPTEVLVSGTKSFLKLSSRFYEPSSQLTLHKTVTDPGKHIHVKKRKGIGYWHEAKHVGDCIEQGLTESPVMSHADTILLMQTLDEVRRIVGLRYKED